MAAACRVNELGIYPHPSIEVTHLRAKQNKAAWEAMKEHFTTRQIVELTFICGMWNLSGRVATSLHLVVEPPGKRIEFQFGDES